MKALITFCLMSFPLISSAVESNCAPEEMILLSCKHKNKLISLCASKDAPSEAGYIQYRVKKAGKLEFEFPKDKKGALKKFSYVSYPQGAGVKFTNDGHEYNLSTNAKGESYVSVTKGSQTVADFTCANVDPKIDLTVNDVLDVISKLKSE